MVQDVFYRMLKGRHTFTGEGEFKTWMYHLARNVVKDFFRKNKHKASHYDASLYTDKLTGGMVADEMMQRKMEIEQLRQAINSLNDESREVLVLSRYQELKYAEIAEILGVSEGAVKVRIHRAINQLKAMYQTVETKN